MADKNGTAEGATCSSKEADSTECTGNWGTMRWYEKPFLMVRDTGKATADDLEKIENYLKEFNMKLRTRDMRDTTTSPQEQDMIMDELVDDLIKLDIGHDTPGLTDDRRDNLKEMFVIESKPFSKVVETTQDLYLGLSISILKKSTDQNNEIWYRRPPMDYYPTDDTTEPIHRRHSSESSVEGEDRNQKHYIKDVTRQTATGSPIDYNKYREDSSSDEEFKEYIREMNKRYNYD